MTVKEIVGSSKSVHKRVLNVLTSDMLHPMCSVFLHYFSVFSVLVSNVFSVFVIIELNVLASNVFSVLAFCVFSVLASSVPVYSHSV